MFNGQVVSWTTQDSKVPRIGLQCRTLPADLPETRAKAPYRRVCAVEAPGPGGLATGPGPGVSSCGPSCGQGQARNRPGTRVHSCGQTATIARGGLGVHHHYSR